MRHWNVYTLDHTSQSGFKYCAVINNDVQIMVTIANVSYYLKGHKLGVSNISALVPPGSRDYGYPHSKQRKLQRH